jgi:phosphate transport system substrate-binding protein
MKRDLVATPLMTLNLIVVIGCGGADSGSAATSITLQGAGASFLAPLYTKVVQDPRRHAPERAGVLSVGRRGRVESVMVHTADFGASDAAMKPEDMVKVNGLVQLVPMTAGSIVLAYERDGLDTFHAAAINAEG